MKLNILKPRNAINKAYLKNKPNRRDIDKFKSNIIELLNHINESESEEYHKNILSEFLKNTYYNPNHYINTKGRADLVIHNDNDAKSSVGVLIETKKPVNKSEMPSKENINSKAVQELILYYLRERITSNNLEIKHLIVTNINEWFVFNANEFEKHFANNKSFIKQFTDFEEGRLSGKTTEFFYKNIVAPFILKLNDEITFTYINIKDYIKVIKNENTKDKNKLITLYKLFTPEHLLKLPFANDSNTLDRSFYNELLYIIGLEETKKGSKRLIGRKCEKTRKPGSLIENAINILQCEDCISQINNPLDYGKNYNEQLYNIALELVITWINRILFLKLLEAQQLKYNAGNISYKFLNTERIPDYDALNKLFFQVLAIKENERSDIVKNKFCNIPYLNSSLFEPSELEHKTIRISNLEDEYSLPLINNTVLKGKTGKRLRGELGVLQYFFDFLDSYDFASEGSEEIQEENKTLINASVLGLIFEKINGYKEGSFFTPGFITMYMCRETIRRSIVQKFKDKKGWNCESINDLYNRIEDKKEANEIINSLKICDPAVGSGHFLVSALNEIIAIKSELKILLDQQGRTLRDYHLEVMNDELVITDSDGCFFEYKPKNKESQRIQETLFHEKQTIIENCLFGVDINPNSVKICRLRLWIELLKSAYYKPETNYAELETLPNIDINIKCGNSLISRYSLDSDIKKALKKSKWTIESYRLAIMSYRNADNKEQKREMLKLIERIKSDFETEVAANDKRVLRLKKLEDQLKFIIDQHELFELTKKEKEIRNARINKITTGIKNLEMEIEEIKSNKIYENAFEWRFEFPEILNDDGVIVGFDIIIGNPPYVRIQELKQIDDNLALQLKESYVSASKGNYDLYVVFVEKGMQLLNRSGQFAYILPHKFFNAKYGEPLRKFISQNKYLRQVIHFGDQQIFVDATNYVCLLFLDKSGVSLCRWGNANNLPAWLKTLSAPEVKLTSDRITAAEWNFIVGKGGGIFDKLQQIPVKLRDIAKIFQGLVTGADAIFVLKNLGNGKYYSKTTNQVHEIEENLMRPICKGALDIRRYYVENLTKSILFPYHVSEHKAQLISARDFSRNYPKAWNYLLECKTKLEGREKGKWKHNRWYALGRSQNLAEMEQAKILTPSIAAQASFTLDKTNYYFFLGSGGGGGGGYGITIRNESRISLEYLLALLNSRLLDYCLHQISSSFRGGYRAYNKQFIEQLPIIIAPPDIQQSLEQLVNQIITEKHNNLSSDTKPLEQEIDWLVYEHYGLTKDEIDVVEDSTK